MKKYFSLLFIFLLTNSYSQTNISQQFSEPKGMEDQLGKGNLLPVEILNLYPLAIGNKWINIIKTVINPYVYYSVTLTEVVSDSIAPNGKLYSCLQEGEDLHLYRVDSLDGKVYGYFEHPNLPESEYLVAPLLGEVGETFTSFNPNSPNSNTYITVTAIDSIYFWGLTKFRKKFLKDSFPVYWQFSLAEDIGPDYTYSGYSGYSMYFEITLKGCVINGIVYGDTILTVVEDKENPIASEFKLEQNYPNPFNPSTKIKFTIPSVIAGGAKQSQIVTLKVYDVLGNEIATLVNEEKPAGEYEVEFNSNSVEGRNLPAGRQGLTSGVYFYQLRVGGPETSSGQAMIQTKKMILLK